MSNKEIARNLTLLAKLMDIHGENSFKVSSYTNAAFRIEKLASPLKDIAKAQITIPGVGDSITTKVKEMLETGKFDILEEYLAKTPATVVEMLKIKGIGPKKIGQLWRNSNISSIDDLEEACIHNQLSSIKGFGSKTQENILKSIQFIQLHQGSYLFSTLQKMALEICTQLKTHFPKNSFKITGDLRRQTLTAQDISILTDVNQEELLKFYANEKNVEVSKQQHVVQLKQEGFPKILIYFSTRENWGKNLFLTTNSKEFNTAFTEHFQLPENPKDEESIFTVNDLTFIPPPLRETAQQLQKYSSYSPQEEIKLIETSQIKGIIHCHSTYSDGANTLEEMARGAKEKGFEYLVISDHSKSAGYANGLYPDRILKQQEEIKRLNTELSPFKIFSSIESDILGDGELDYEAEVLAGFDLVIASIHSNLTMDQKKATHRLLTAIQNPFTTILGHPTGRLLLSRPGYPVDFKQVIDACAREKVVIEINANPKRLDLDWEWIPYALEKGVLLSINPDAHAISEMDLIQYGVMSAQKGGLTKEQNLSSLSLQEFELFLKSRRQKD